MPNKSQFIDMLAERLDGDRKRAAVALDAVIDSIYAAIAGGDRVGITGFGVFERRERAARTARNPATGASVDVAASRVPAFRPGTEFRDIASGAREHTGHVAGAQAVATKASGTVRAAPTKAARKAVTKTTDAAPVQQATKPATKSATKSATKQAAKSAAKAATKADTKSAKKSVKKADTKKADTKKADTKSAKKSGKKSAAKK